MVYQLVYTSQAGRGMDAAAYEALAKNRALKNTRKDITGMLLFAKGTIIHVIEGPKGAVTALYEKISRDTRHAEVTLMAEHETQTREYAGQPLAFMSVQASQGQAIMQSLSQQAFLAEQELSASQFDEDCIFSSVAGF